MSLRIKGSETTTQMTILGNPLLSGVFLALNLGSLAITYYSYKRKNYYFSFLAFLIWALTGILYFFLCTLNGDFFLLSSSQDFTANLLYLSAILAGFTNALFGMKLYYQHRVVSAIIIQLAMFFSSVLLIVHLSDSAYNFYVQEKAAKKRSSAKGFHPTENFETRQVPEDSIRSK